MPRRAGIHTHLGNKGESLGIKEIGGFWGEIALELRSAGGEKPSCEGWSRLGMKTCAGRVMSTSRGPEEGGVGGVS